MKEQITKNVRKTPFGYEGYISAWLGKAKLWVEYSGIHRIDTLSALEDAKYLLEDYRQRNVLDGKPII